MSKPTRHTPGPWQARFIYRMIRAARETAGLIMNSKPENDWPDAELMSAAPDLLAYAECMAARRKDRIDHRHGVNSTEFIGLLARNGWDYEEPIPRFLTRLRSRAITKATGATP